MLRSGRLRRPDRMNPGSRNLVRVSASLATREPEAIRAELGVACETCDPRDVEEVLLQAYLFLGYPAALTGLALWREVSGRGSDPPVDEDRADFEARGEAVCRQVYGAQYDGLRRNVRALHPALDRWMIEEGYGRVLGRPGLALPMRELAIVGLLAVLDAPVQLYSHLRGALAVGARPSEVEDALRSAEDFMSDATRSRAWDCWNRLRDPHGGTSR